jgi:predicted ABC-type ATPase
VKAKRLFIIAGCNGAGKTTASYNILPELLNCKEFVNADEIARGLSPFQPESVSIEAGRIMLKRIDELILSGNDFAFETTLATKSFIKTIEKAKTEGYFVSLIFFYLDSTSLAKKRVAKRVLEGGHNIESAVIERRYYAGINNLFNKYNHCVDYLLIYDNSNIQSILVAEKQFDQEFRIFDKSRFTLLQSSVKQ